MNGKVGGLSKSNKHENKELEGGQVECKSQDKDKNQSKNKCQDLGFA